MEVKVERNYTKQIKEVPSSCNFCHDVLCEMLGMGIFMDILRCYESSHINSELLSNTFWVESLSKVYPEHTHDFYEFFIITEGTCRHIANGQVQLLNPGALVFIRPEDIHRYEYAGEGDCRFLNVTCRRSLISDTFTYFNELEFLQHLLNSPSPQVAILSKVETEDFVSRFERFNMLAIIDKVKARVYLKSLIVDVFSKHFFYMQDKKKKSIPLWMESLLYQMQDKKNFCKGLSAMYELSGRSIGHVNRVFRQYLQQTPTEYINQVKLNYAKNLLLTTELSVLEISLESGFENLSHFYHQFKKYYSQTPLDLRKGR